MLKLSRFGIRTLASGDVAYSRGLELFKSGSVRSASFSKNTNQYIVSVKDNFDYQVTITANEDGSFEHNCNCPMHLREKGACIHTVAALLFLLRYQEQQQSKTPRSPEEKRAYSVLEYFNNMEERTLPVEVYRLDLVITIPEIIKENSENLPSLSIRVGNTRYYKVQSIKRFISDYVAHNDIVLGKEFHYSFGESEFDRTSQEIIDFIREIYEIQGMVDGQYSTRIFQKSQLMLTHHLLMKLFKVIGKNQFELNLYGRTFEKTRFFNENPNIRYDLDPMEDAIVLDYRDSDAVIPLSENGDLIFYNGAVFAPNSKFRRNYIPFFNNLGRGKPALIFRGDARQRFLEEVLPRLHDSMDIDIPEELQDRYLFYDLESKLYFDKYKSGIKAELHFKYGEYEFNCFEDPKSDFYILMRQKEKEEEIMQKVEDLGFEAHSSFYYLKQDTAIYEFLSASHAELSDYCEVYYSEDFKKLKLHSAGRMKLGMSVKEGSDLLELNVEYGDVPREELRELFRSIKVRKKYYRLHDGTFIDLSDPNLVKMAEVMEDLNISHKDLTGETITLKNSQAFYLEESFKNVDCDIEKNDGFIKLIENISSCDALELEKPDAVKADLRAYQLTGFRWLCMLADSNLGGILADDMGLGKTLQAITYMVARKKEGTHYLIVCPSSVCFNWLDELENFCPSLSAAVVSGAPETRTATIKNYENTDILITSYPLIRRDIMHYRGITFDTVFLDEAQFIKNAASLSAQSVKLLNGVHRFALTGTPIENSLSELWSIFDFLMPGFLHSHTKFVNKYEKPILKEEKAAYEALNTRIRPFIMRRMKKDVLKELPSKLEEKMVTEMNPEQRKIYLSYLENVRGELFGEIERQGVEKVQMKVLAALTRLRQICCHPSTFLENYEGGSGKLNLLLEVVENAIANDHRILIFSQFTSMLSIIAKEFDERGFSYFVLEGSTPVQERLESIKRFNGGERQIYLISLKAGGTGLNLTGADTVIHYDPWWNPAVEDQATDRAYRIGQTNNVYVLRLLTKGTIEEKIYKLQHKKKELSDSVIGAREVFLSHLTKEELIDIFTP